MRGRQYAVGTRSQRANGGGAKKSKKILGDALMKIGRSTAAG
jgi:hypothetical protein